MKEVSGPRKNPDAGCIVLPVQLYNGVRSRKRFIRFNTKRYFMGNGTA